MKSACILLLALFAAALFAAPAQAAPPVHAKAVGKSAADVIAYWTDERMRNAKPAPLARGNGAGKKSAQYPFTRYEDTSYDPRHGKVFFTDGGVNYVCSGTALTSGNRSVVWTAGHCLNEGPGGYYTNFVFVPAYRDNVRPFGTWAARKLLTTAPWADRGDFTYDLGAAVMSTNAAGQALTDVIGGGREIAFNYEARQHYLSHGYPAASPFNGQRAYICEADLALRDGSSTTATMGIGCDMTGGSSGGGWVVGNTVHSVNSYHYQTLRNVMFGPYQGDVAQSLYTTAAR